VNTRHHCLLLGSPWSGIHGTRIHSARHYGRHWHATFGVGLVEQGAHHSASGRGGVDAYAGDLITTNPGEVHDGRPLGGPARRWSIVYLEPGVVASMLGDPASGRAGHVEITQPVIRDARLRRAVQLLLQRLAQWNATAARDAAATLACEEALVQACTLLLARHATAAPAAEVPADVARARQRLADDLLHPPTLGELAGLEGLSKYQLLRRFQKACGLPPHAWLLQQRAERARGLIRQGCSLAQAAAACGFADQSHMTRLFGRQFGFTPGAWQQATAAAAT
jgi:AraC-like DNA-binding protein